MIDFFRVNDFLKELYFIFDKYNVSFNLDWDEEGFFIFLCCNGVREYFGKVVDKESIQSILSQR